MKRKLNIFCALIFIILFASVGETCSGLILGFKAGMEAADVSSKIDKKESATDIQNSQAVAIISNLKTVSLMPDRLLNTERKMINDLTKDTVDVWPFEMMVACPPAADAGSAMATMRTIFGLMPFLTIFLGLASMAFFIRFIIHINRQKVFCWENVKFLRRLGVSLILFAASDSAVALYAAISVSEEFQLTGYSINYWSCFPFVTILLGLVSFIVAEAFSVGLKLQEEQDLTI